MTTTTSTADTLVLDMAEDAWLGNAEFIVTVDGVQIGGDQTVTALNGFGQFQPFTITGNFGAGPHKVAVTFLNDAYGGSSQMDRNLYLDAIDLDGTSMTVNANVGSTTTETITAEAPPPATDTLTLAVSEDAWKGNAKFVVLVDGVQVGGTQTTTALHGEGQTQNITLTGDFGPGSHSVVVKFINDAYGGSATEDRNLYVSAITYDGTETNVSDALYTNSSSKPVTVSDVPTITAGAPQDGTGTVTVELSEDAYQGTNAQFFLFVDGTIIGEEQTVTASHTAGAEDTFTFTGNWGTGSHQIAIDLANGAASLGTVGQELSLYVDSVTFDGVAQPGLSAALHDQNAAYFNVSSTPPSTTGPDTMVLYVSEDYYLADAQFSVAVDGNLVAGVFTATGSHAAGDTLPVTITGNFGSGPHTVTVTFLNDASGGSSALDRNLYVSGIVYNGVYTGVDASLYYTGAQSVTTVNTGGTAPTPLANMSAPGTLQYVGVNLSGLEFGGAVYPGVLNTDYVMPTNAEIDYYASEGMNVIRLPFDWERLQPVLNGPLDQTYLSLIDNVVNYAATKGITVDLDVHNYGLYYGNLIGSAAVPNSAFADLWSQIATHYASTPNVMFGLMNEPSEPTAAQWLTSANDAIAAIRAAGANQEILVPGVHSTGGVSWTTTDNASVMDGIVDPKMNFAIEIHQYLDPGGSGTSTAVVSPTAGVQDLTAVTQWAEATGNRLFLAEFGSGSDSASLTAMQNMLDYVTQNTNVWQGTTEWGGGPWWGNYGFATDPVNGVTQPQIALLHQYTPGTH